MDFESVKPRVEFLKRADLPDVKEGDHHVVIQGEFKGTDQGKFGDYHIVKDVEGKHWGLPGSVTLDDKFAEVGKGSNVRVLYTGWGTSQTSGKDYRCFDVQQEKMVGQELPLPVASKLVGNDDDLKLD